MPTSPTLATLAADTSTPVLMTTEECAHLLKCAPATLNLDRVRRRWKVPFLRVGRNIRYDRAAVLAWLAARNSGTVAG